MTAFVRFLVLGAAAALAPLVATADPLCDGVKAVLAAGEERPVPYDSLVSSEEKRSPQGKLKSMAPIPALARLPDGAVCYRYLAELADGILGGGPRNFVECDVGRADSADLSDLKETRARMITGIKACLEPGGWTAAKSEMRTAAG